MALTLSVTELAAERGGRLVFAGLSFMVRSGEILEIVGPNGAGKSTLLRVLAGLLTPRQGGIVLEPPAADDSDAPLAERIHYLGHADALKPALTASENLCFAQALGGKPASAPSEALVRFGLPHVADLPCAYLSAGQRRRVALARLLVSVRPLWLLDEPATALDPPSQALLAGLMRDHLAAGGLILAVTHARLGIPDGRMLRLGAGQAAGGEGRPTTSTGRA